VKVNRKDLLRILKLLRPAVAKREIIEQQTHFIITGSDIVSYNAQISISHPFKSEISCSVKADEFYNILESMQADEVTLTLEANQLKIEDEFTKAGLSTVVEDVVSSLIESLKTQMEIEWKKVPDNFIEGLKLCMFSASKDMTKGKATCIGIQGINIFGSDDRRISWYTLQEDMGNFLIPARDIVELVKFPEIKEYWIADNWAHFRTDQGVTFSVLKFPSNEYPDASRHFNNIEGTKVRLPDELKEAVEACAIMTEGDIQADKKINVHIGDKKIVCGAVKERGWIERTVITTFTKDCTFSINPYFFSQVLDKSTRVTIGEKRAVFAQANFKHIISLPLTY
jgi:DNA polymerase III sliding clamp (beta) subunit (PCNA family)